MFDLQRRHPLQFENIWLPDSPSSSSAFALSPFMWLEYLSAEAVRTCEVCELGAGHQGQATSASDGKSGLREAPSLRLAGLHPCEWPAGHASASSCVVRLVWHC